MMKFYFHENNNKKVFKSETFNYSFNKQTGYTMIWGKTPTDNPTEFPFPMLIDYEITQRCSGIGEYGNCKFCYKDNNPYSGYVTPLDEAKQVIDHIPSMCTQIAFGTDAKLESNPQWFDIFCYAKSKGFVPNVTVADISNVTAEKLASVCGAVAVSRYARRHICYESVQKLLRAGMKQVYIHVMLSKETLSMVNETLYDLISDPRLKNITAVIFLSLKKKGGGSSYKSITQTQFSEVVNTCVKYNIPFGFDSCSAKKFLKSIKGTEYEKYAIYAEKCESFLYSMYINAYGNVFPCSFVDGTTGWENGLDILNCNNFIKEIWEHPRAKEFRKKLLENDRQCPFYKI